MQVCETLYLALEMYLGSLKSITNKAITKTRNHPKPPKTSQNHPKPAKTSQSQPKPPKTTQNEPKPPKTSQI